MDQRGLQKAARSPIAEEEREMAAVVHAREGLTGPCWTALSAPRAYTSECKEEQCATRIALSLFSYTGTPQSDEISSTLVQAQKRLETRRSVHTTQRGKWDELAKTSYGCVSCTEASSLERMYRFTEEY